MTTRTECNKAEVTSSASSAVVSVDDSAKAPPAVAKRNSRARHSSSGGAGAATAVNGRGEGEGGRRRKTRRSRRWKPYHKLTAEEKIALEQREEIRAEQSRARRFAHGQPMAPYNTTQFLLNDLEQRTSGDWEETNTGGARLRAISESELGNASETASGSHSDVEEMDREFETEYNNANAERLEALSKAELVRELLRSETVNDQMYVENRQLRAEVLQMRKQLEQFIPVVAQQ